MKSLKSVLFVSAGAGVAFSILLLAQQRYTVKAEFSDDGLKSLRCNGFDFLENGGFGVRSVVLRGPSGETRPGINYGTYRFNAQLQELNGTFPWGKIIVTYTASGNRLTLKVATINTSNSDTIVSVWYQPLRFKFPLKVKEYDGSIPLLAHNIGQVAVSRASYGSGALAAVSEDVAKPMQVGFPWADNKPENTVFPLTMNTGRVALDPDSTPFINRPITPNSSDEYRLSVRFGPASEDVGEFASDLYKKFAEVYPSKLNWQDRRPIGAIFLASAGETTTNNPRAWFNDHKLDINTPSGCAEFRQRILGIADSAISIMKDMNAQGAITWDIEGEQYTQADYIGDPRRVNELAPEMADLADEYFARFRRAGLRVGVCVRPQQLQISADRKTAAEVALADPTPLLIEKINYARKRWGASIVYIDSNINSYDPNPLNVEILEKLHAVFPDVLLVPEHSNLRYYAYSAPYQELRHGSTGTPDAVLQTYPRAFSLIYTADGLLDYYHKSLARAIKNGDTLMYRTWWHDPQNERVKTLASR